MADEAKPAKPPATAAALDQVRPAAVVPVPAAVTRPAAIRIDRSTVERVLARAAEMQSASGDEPGLSEGLTEDQLIDVGREVGLSSFHLRQALAEERTRVGAPDERGLMAQVAGASMATARRTINGSPAEIMATLNRMMIGDECMAVKRRYGERFTWEPRRDIWAAVRRFTAPSRTYDLLRAREVAATAAAIDEQRTILRLDADVSNARTARIRGGVAIATGALIASGATFVFFSIIGAPLLGALALGAVPAVLGIVASAALARTHRRTVERSQLALEQILDRLERGETRRPGNFLDVLTSG